MAKVRTSTRPRAAVLTMAAAGIASATYQASGSWRDRRRFPPPGRLVEVGGRRVHLWPAGDGGPTVVVVPALGTSGLEWTRIRRALAPDATVVLYDRAGLGWSDPGPRPRTAGRIADELHDLLQAAGVPPPYLLVGHSLGGLVVRLHAARHPDQVAAAVLVDPTPEDYQRRVGRLDWRHSIPGFWLRVARLRLRPLGCDGWPATSASSAARAGPPRASSHPISRRRPGAHPELPAPAHRRSGAARLGPELATASGLGGAKLNHKSVVLSDLAIALIGQNRPEHATAVLNEAIDLVEYLHDGGGTRRVFIAGRKLWPVAQRAVCAGGA
jgi:pimeloyl-ACP methyl ester carboxylesterase